MLKTFDIQGISAGATLSGLYPDLMDVYQTSTTTSDFGIVSTGTTIAETGGSKLRSAQPCRIMPADVKDVPEPLFSASLAYANLFWPDSSKGPLSTDNLVVVAGITWRVAEIAEGFEAPVNRALLARRSA